MVACNKTAFVSAGGTGGHLFPAAALSAELKKRGWTIHLLTDGRAEKYADDFPADERHRIESATLSGKNPIKLLGSALSILKGIFAARKLARNIKPAVAIGFGGYPTLPPIMGANQAGVPCLIHEQNAVMGRANHALASRVKAIAGGFLASEGSHQEKIVVVGNPVRPDVIKAAKIAFVAPAKDKPFELLVFGGSQGAHYFAEAIPAAIALLDEKDRARLCVTMQVRSEDLKTSSKLFDALGLEADLRSFFDDMPARIAKTHFVISRSGASTVSEIAAIGRPALLVPYPHALDHDQAANAAQLAKAGGVIVRPQSSLTPEALAAILKEAMADPKALAQKAAASKSAGQIDATLLLADLVEAIAKGETVQAYKARLKSKL